MPTFTRDEIVDTAVGRIFRPADREKLEVAWQQMLADPDAGPVARQTEAYLKYLEENCECPIARFERLSGYPLPEPGAYRARGRSPHT